MPSAPASRALARALAAFLIAKWISGRGSRIGTATNCQSGLGHLRPDSPESSLETPSAETPQRRLTRTTESNPEGQHRSTAADTHSLHCSGLPTKDWTCPGSKGRLKPCQSGPHYKVQFCERGVDSHPLSIAPWERSLENIVSIVLRALSGFCSALSREAHCHSSRPQSH